MLPIVWPDTVAFSPTQTVTELGSKVEKLDENLHDGIGPSYWEI